MFKKKMLLLEERLRNPLPGKAAQIKMASYQRLNDLSYKKIPINPLKSSVLIFLYYTENECKFILIERTTNKSMHSGQIALPGGKFEQIDYVLKQTALREAHEEIGIDISGTTIIGNLTELYIPPSNFIVHPFIGFSETKQNFKRQVQEVEKIIEVKVNELLNPNIIQKTDIKVRDFIIRDTPIFKICDYQIWGATAMILSEFIQVWNESAD